MERYWIISANVNGPGSATKWNPLILRDHAAFMGWQGERADSPRAKHLFGLFAGIKEGDAVLIAYGGLLIPGQRRLVACGRADGGRGKGSGHYPDGRPHKNSIHLDPFCQLDDDPAKEGVTFEDTPHWGGNQPVAIFEIRPDDKGYAGNGALCRWLDSRIAAAANQPTNLRSPAPPRTRTASLSLDSTDGYEMEWAARVIKSHPAERRLVKEFVEWLLATKKYSPEVKSYECTTGWPTCDLYYPKRNILIEAKATVDRGAIRMAIGQLFDYSYLHVRGDGTLRPPKLGLLVPQKVDDDLGGLLKSLDITVIWKEGAEFRDSVKGRFFT